MSKTLTTLVQDLEKGYVKMIRFDTDKILYVSGKRKKVSTALDFPCETPEKLKSLANGGKTYLLDYSDITRFRTRSDRKTIDIGFKDAKGRSCTIDIDASDNATKALVFQTVSGLMQGSGFEKSKKPASAFSVSLVPVLVMLATIVIGGLITALEGTGKGVQLDEDSFGTSRRSRQAQGVAKLVAFISNTIGFWGCLVVTLAILLGALVYLLQRLANRPVVTVLNPKT